MSEMDKYYKIFYDDYWLSEEDKEYIKITEFNTKEEALEKVKELARKTVLISAKFSGLLDGGYRFMISPEKLEMNAKRDYLKELEKYHIIDVDDLY